MLHTLVSGGDKKVCGREYVSQSSSPIILLVFPLSRNKGKYGSKDCIENTGLRRSLKVEILGIVRSFRKGDVRIVNRRGWLPQGVNLADLVV